MKEVPTTQRISGEATGGATIMRGKVLEGIIEDDQTTHSSYAYCACGSGGGGCSGGFDRSMST